MNKADSFDPRIGPEIIERSYFSEENCSIVTPFKTPTDFAAMTPYDVSKHDEQWLISERHFVHACEKQ